MWWYIGGGIACVVLYALVCFRDYCKDEEVEIDLIDLESIFLYAILSWIGLIVMAYLLLHGVLKKEGGVLFKFKKKDKKNNNESGTLD